MKNLYDKDAEKEVVGRLNSLSAESARKWGKMEVDQMLAHCTAALEVAAGQKFPPRLFIGKLLGGMVKKSALGDKPWSKGSPTDKSFIITDRRNFEQERAKLIVLIRQFAKAGPAKCTRHTHSFFGKLTPDEWGTLMYKHLDHHLKQFGA